MAELWIDVLTRKPDPVIVGKLQRLVRHIIRSGGMMVTCVLVLYLEFITGAYYHLDWDAFGSVLIMFGGLFGFSLFFCGLLWHIVSISDLVKLRREILRVP
jgi:uncharacterized membrane protein